MNNFRKKWFNDLCQKFDKYSIINNNDKINYMDYFELSNICYPISEYIIKEIKYNSKKKDEVLNIVFKDQLKTIYNYKYYFNTLKHMNKENEFIKLSNENLNSLYNELITNTKILLDNYKKNSVTQETFDSFVINSLMTNIYEILNKNGFIIDDISINVFRNHDLSYTLKLIVDSWRKAEGSGTAGFYHVDVLGEKIKLLIPGEDKINLENHIGNIQNFRYTFYNYKEYENNNKS